MSVVYLGIGLITGLLWVMDTHNECDELIKYQRDPSYLIGYLWGKARPTIGVASAWQYARSLQIVVSIIACFQVAMIVDNDALRIGALFATIFNAASFTAIGPLRLRFKLGNYELEYADTLFQSVGLVSFGTWLTQHP